MYDFFNTLLRFLLSTETGHTLMKIILHYSHNVRLSRRQSVIRGNNTDYQLDATITPNSVALVRERTIPTERPPPVGEVSANFCG